MEGRFGNEIITLQFGGLSNLTGCMMWHSQMQRMDEEEETKEETKKPPTDSISDNICWHFGDSSRWPRALLFDLKGTLEGLLPEPDYIQKEEISIEWSGKSNVISTEAAAESLFSGMEFNIPFSSHSLHGLYNFKLGVDPFDSFTLGKTVMQLDEKEIIVDKFRRFSEDCDTLQGIQCLIDVDSGFSGFASDMLTYIRDEYPTAPIITYGLTNPQMGNTKQIIDNRTANINLSLYNFSSLSSGMYTGWNEVLITSVYVPLSSERWSAQTFPRLPAIEPTNMVHMAGVYAACIDTLSLANRLEKGMITLGEMTSILNCGSYANISTLCASLPMELEADYQGMFQNAKELYLSPFSHPLIPFVKKAAPFSEVTVFRGRSIEHDLKKAFSEYLSRTHSLRASAIVEQPFSAAKPYPFFHDVQKVNVLAHLQTSKGLHKYLQSLVTQFMALDKKVLVSDTTSVDDIKDIENHLQSIVESYDNE